MKIKIVFSFILITLFQNVNSQVFDNNQAVSEEKKHQQASVDTMVIDQLDDEKNYATASKPSKLKHPVICCYDAYQNVFIKANVEASAMFSGGDNAPFWLMNNNYGIGSLDKNSQYVRAGIVASQQLATINSKPLMIRGGADIIAANNLQSDFFIQQLYANLRYRSLGLSIGSKERVSEYLDGDLSVGAMTHSINYRPIPQVEVGFPDYQPIPFTNHRLFVKGGLSYGKFLDNDYATSHAADGWYALNVLYHRKYAFFMYENQKPFNFIFGLDMGAQFGGDSYKYGEYDGSSPHKFIDFIRILIPSSGGSDAPGIDQVNIIGNVYGSWHFATNYRKQDFQIKVYHEHYFDDHSGMWFKNFPDGLYGIELNLKRSELFSHILFEYIHTKDQSGPMLWDQTPEIPIQVSGRDEYYNSWDYASLSTHGFVLGNPLITSPIYNKGRSLKIYNSRVSAFNIGVRGRIHRGLFYRVKATYSRNWGTYMYPYLDIQNQFSSLIELTYTPYKLYKWSFSGAFAYDISDVVGNNTGVRLKIARSINIR